MTVHDDSKSANISKELWKAGMDSADDQGTLACKSLVNSWKIISTQDSRLCDGVSDCKSRSDELCPYVTFCTDSKNGKTSKELWKAGLDIVDAHGNIVCKNSIDRWEVITTQDKRFCDGVPDCKSGSDELCSYVTIRTESKSANISRKFWDVGAVSKDGEGNIVCKISEDTGEICDGESNCMFFELCQYATLNKSSQKVKLPKDGKWNAYDIEDEEGNVACRSSTTKKWIILGFDQCKRCNKVEDCNSSIDEISCPVYVAPSFELPIYCCLVVLVLGILLHHGWQAVITTAEKESLELEKVRTKILQLEEAVDFIVEATIKDDQPFPGEAYAILHDSTSVSM